jgi:hypothetical protein
MPLPRILPRFFGKKPRLNPLVSLRFLPVNRGKLHGKFTHAGFQRSPLLYQNISGLSYYILLSFFLIHKKFMRAGKFLDFPNLWAVILRAFRQGRRSAQTVDNSVNN